MGWLLPKMGNGDFDLCGRELRYFAGGSVNIRGPSMYTAGLIGLMGGFMYAYQCSAGRLMGMFPNDDEVARYKRWLYFFDTLWFSHSFMALLICDCKTLFHRTCGYRVCICSKVIASWFWRNCGFRVCVCYKVIVSLFHKNCGFRVCICHQVIASLFCRNYRFRVFICSKMVAILFHRNCAFWVCICFQMIAHFI